MKRELLIEKWIVPSYVEHNGTMVWFDRYGNKLGWGGKNIYYTGRTFFEDYNHIIITPEVA